jgi:hypothetical protein
MTPEFNKWWDGDDMTAENPYTKDTPAFWAWEGWVAGSKSTRKWVGLTEAEAAQCWDSSAVQTWKNIEAKLREKNHVGY